MPGARAPDPDQAVRPDQVGAGVQQDGIKVGVCPGGGAAAADGDVAQGDADGGLGAGAEVTVIMDGPRAVIGPELIHDRMRDVRAAGRVRALKGVAVDVLGQDVRDRVLIRAGLDLDPVRRRVAGDRGLAPTIARSRTVQFAAATETASVPENDDPISIFVSP